MTEIFIENLLEKEVVSINGAKIGLLTEVQMCFDGTGRGDLDCLVVKPKTEPNDNQAHRSKYQLKNGNFIIDSANVESVDDQILVA